MRFFAIPVLLLVCACAQEETSAPAANEAAAPQAVEAPATPIAEAEALEVVNSGGVYLSQLWIAEGFAAPEGAAEAPESGYFISNVAGEGSAKDGEGWISLISAGGQIVKERFAEGLDAPKGMAVLGGILYVADIDRVRMIDAATGEAKGDIPVEGAQFLNDVAVWNGAVYVSDSQMATVSRLDGGAATSWLVDERLSGVNGLLGAGDRLLISTMSTGSLYQAGADGALAEIASGMIDADGIGVVPGGGWLVSAWRGDIFYVAPDGSTAKLLDTREAGILQNDLSVFGDVVIVPNWMPGTVTAWRIVR